MDSKFSKTPSFGEKFKELALSALRAFGYGCLTAAGMSAVIFAFAYFTSGMDMFTGIDWVRRVMYVISSYFKHRDQSLILASCHSLCFNWHVCSYHHF